MGNSLSLLELFDILEKELDVKLAYTKLSQRKSDQKVFVADINKATKLTGWEPEVNKIEGVRMTLDWLTETVSPRTGGKVRERADRVVKAGTDK